MRIGKTRWVLLLCVLVLGSAGAAEPTGQELVAHVERLLWGKTSQGAAEMTVITPRWQRKLEMRFWMERPERTFIRIVSPPKEAGIGSLRIKAEMWNYLPAVERVIKIPPSMMLQPWMGSDLTNDDLVKESSAVEDYTHTLGANEEIDGIKVYRVDSIPKPEAAVVWGKVVYKIRIADRIPLRQEYYDERGELIKVLRFLDVRELGGRLIPTRWQMQPVQKPQNRTEFVLRQMTFDAPIPADVFALRNLQRTR
ncbi:MAG: outer membrane lipoprotein-sorting protein [Gammaproteobacteria bacterium]|nr:outer membrane lipoprotein-sorting protein [Gammaproteobacteria bacterium]